MHCETANLHFRSPFKHLALIRKAGSDAMPDVIIDISHVYTKMLHGSIDLQYNFFGEVTYTYKYLKHYLWSNDGD